MHKPSVSLATVEAPPQFEAASSQESYTHAVDEFYRSVLFSNALFVMALESGAGASRAGVGNKPPEAPNQNRFYCIRTSEAGVPSRYFRSQKDNSGLPGFGCISVPKAHSAGQASGSSILVNTSGRLMWPKAQFP
jgi:hypothetical protein